MVARVLLVALRVSFDLIYNKGGLNSESIVWEKQTGPDFITSSLFIGQRNFKERCFCDFFLQRN